MTTDLVDGHLQVFHGAAVAGAPDVLQAREDVVPGTVAAGAERKNGRGDTRDDATQRKT